MRRCIYIIVNEKTQDFKIGIAKDSVRRIKALQTGSSDVLYILYNREIEHASKVERSLHHDFAEYRKTGEWFSPNAILSLSEFDDKVIKYEQMFIALQDNPFLG